MNNQSYTLLNSVFNPITQEFKVFNLKQAQMLLSSIETFCSLNDDVGLTDFLKHNPLTSIIHGLKSKEKGKDYVLSYFENSFSLGSFNTQKIILDDIFKHAELYFNLQYFEEAISSIDSIIYSLNSPSLMHAYSYALKEFIDTHHTIYKENKDFLDDVLDVTYLINKSLEYSSFNNINYLLGNTNIIDYIKDNSDSIMSYNVKDYLMGVIIKKRENRSSLEASTLDEYQDRQNWNAFFKSMDLMFYDCELNDIIRDGIKQNISSLSASYGIDKYMKEMFKQCLIHNYINFDDKIKSARSYGNNNTKLPINEFFKFKEEEVKKIEKSAELFLVQREKEQIEKSLSKRIEKNGNKLKI
jgi:hypothetical protein